MDFITLILFIVGIVILIVGAEALVRGASGLATMMGISPLVIGLTVVAFGTSAPELAVSVQSAFSGQPDIALGNVVGSNILNVLLILGVSAAITPLVVSKQLVRLDVPIMIGVSILGMLLGLDNKISRWDGVLLFSLVVIYTTFLVRLSRKETQMLSNRHEIDGVSSPKEKSGGSGFVNAGFIVGGLAMLILGSRWLVNGAVVIAHMMGVSELVIGLTVVAIGTSLPEVATSVVASLRGQRDIAVGNVVGSNIFNVLTVLGVASMVSPQGINVSAAVLSFDMPIMIAVAIACLPIFFTGHIIARWEGFLFLGYYVAYTTYLVLQSTHHDMLSAFSEIMVVFVIPLTVVTLAVVTWRALRGHR
jgi:cation:H+ antiporter